MPRGPHVIQVLSLYKRILRLQRGLPTELQELGKGYIRDEFKRHKEVGLDESIVFLNEWATYANVLSMQLTPKGIAKGSIGQDLSQDRVGHLSDEQILQLYELKQEAEKKKKRS